jgi:4-aminobutyrate aminotransferase
MPAPVRTQQQWAEFGKAHVTHGLGRLKEEVMVKGEGVWLYNADGQKYLDFTAGIGVTNLGQYVNFCSLQVENKSAMGIKKGRAVMESERPRKGRSRMGH